MVMEKLEGNQKRIYLGLPVEELDLMYGGNERGGDMNMDKDDMDWETYFFQIWSRVKAHTT